MYTSQCANLPCVFETWSIKASHWTSKILLGTTAQSNREKSKTKWHHHLKTSMFVEEVLAPAYLWTVSNVWLLYHNSHKCLVIALFCECVCHLGFFSSPSFPVVLQIFFCYSVCVCKRFVDLPCETIFKKKEKKKEKFSPNFQRAHARLIIFDLCLPAPTSVWCLNHFGPTPTGCCHWSWYKTVFGF